MGAAKGAAAAVVIVMAVGAGGCGVTAVADKAEEGAGTLNTWGGGQGKINEIHR